MGEETSLIEALVTGIICLMLVAAVTTMASKRLSKLPLTIALVFVGIAISALSDRVPALGLISSSVHLTPQLVLYVFIPTLIFESAFNMNAREVSRNIWPIMMLAGPGLILSTLIIGGMMAWMTHFDLMVAMLLGAILSATDPVAVIAIFKQLGVPERLTVLVEGESLFNDATSLVVATILLGILVKGDFSAAVVGDGVVQFFVVFFGGVLVGWLLAIIAGQTLGRIEEDPLVEITLTTILAYFSFIVADHVFHVSGIMAVVASGLTIGSWGRSKISPSTEAFMKHFWEYLAYLANAFIFLMVGMEMNLVTLWHSIGLIAAVALAMLVSRAAVVFLLVPLVGKLPGSEPTSLPWQGVMYWGGLRGAIAIAIVLSLPHFAYKDTLIAVVLGAVLFTLIVEGLSIEPMVKWLGLDALSLPDQLVKLEGDRHARQEGLARLDTVVSGGMFSTRVAENIRARSLREIAELDAELKKLHTSMDASEARELLAMRCLVREKARYRELFARGLINEWAYRELDNTVNVQLDGVRHQAALPSARFETSFGKALDLFLIRALEHVPGMGRIAEGLRAQRTIRDYDVAWGRYRGASSVLAGMKELAGDGEVAQPIVDDMRAVYEDIRAVCKSHIDDMEEQYPEFVETIQEHLGQRLMLIAEHESVEHAADLGIIHEGVADKILKEQNERLRLLKRDDVVECFEISAGELLRKVPVFNGMSEAQFAEIARYLRPKTVPRGSHIIDQGARGNSMFLIGRGVANVYILEQGQSEQAATLYAGNFFGEGAMLHESNRNATVIAATPCTLYELRGMDLDRICETHPRIREIVERVDRERADANTTRHGQT